MAIIGIDFDNTIANYERSFAQVGKASGLLARDSRAQSKTEIRSELRAMDDGEKTWQTLQGLVYGKHILEAKLFSGLTDFIRHARAHGDRLYIVSHKTLLAHHDPDETNLRDAALGFMKHHGFFDQLGFARDDIFFELTRPDKAARIAALGCDIFIDDLEEMFAESGFPDHCRQLLLSKTPVMTQAAHRMQCCENWDAVAAAVYLHGRPS